MKTFLEYQDDKLVEDFVIKAEDMVLTEEQEALVEDAVNTFIAEGKGVEDLEAAFLDEGIFGSLLGGITGAALGKTVGKMICKVLGIQKGVLYDLLTSRIVGAALGAVIGKRF